MAVHRVASYVDQSQQLFKRLRVAQCKNTQNLDALEQMWKNKRSTPLSIREMRWMIGQTIQQTTSLGQVPAEATLHSLRHTFATRYLLRHPGDLVGLARLLGHTSIQATQISVQPTEAEMARRVNQIDLNAYAL